MTRHLAAGSSRRRMLAGGIGAAAAMLAGATVLEAKPKRKNNRNAKKKGTNGAAEGAGTEKVVLCHRNKGRKGFSLIEVGAPAVPAHEAHGDTVCEVRECFAPVGCEDGECTYEATAGASCDDGAGLCTAEGQCEALIPAPEE